MRFQFSRQGLEGTERIRERIFECLPGATSWTLLAGMLVLSFWKPFLAAVLVIAIDLYWLLKLLYLTLFLVLSYLRLSLERQTDWMARVEAIGRWPTVELTPPLPHAAPAQRLSHWIFQRRMLALAASGRPPPPLAQIHHLVIIPMSTETQEIVEPGVTSLSRQRFPPSRILVVLAVEGRASDEVKAGAARIQAHSCAQFLDVMVVEHPDGLPGEARVKGANVTWAAKAAARVFQERGVPFERVVASCFDADTVVSEQYMACLTYHFMMCPQRTRASF